MIWKALTLLGSLALHWSTSSEIPQVISYVEDEVWVVIGIRDYELQVPPTTLKYFENTVPGEAQKECDEYSNIICWIIHASELPPWIITWYQTAWFQKWENE